MTTKSQVFQTSSTYDPAAKVWHGLQREIKYGPQYSVGAAALEALQRDPAHISQICHHNGKQYTNREIAVLSIRVAQHFERMNMPQCTVIGLCAANSDFIAPLFFGATLAGLIVSTLDPSFEMESIKHTFSITKPKLMFCDGDVFDKVQAALTACKLPCTVYTVHQHLVGIPELTEFLAETGTEVSYRPKPLIHGFNQTAAILCSSGTTGLPKGVCVSHASLMNACFLQLAPADIMVGFSTLYWASGILVLVCATLRSVTRVITAIGFSPEAFFDIIQKYKVTATFTPPSQIALSAASDEIGKYNLSSLRTYLTGGSAIPHAVIEKMRPHLPNAQFIAAYGMSETGGAIAIGDYCETRSNGQLADNVTVRVINAEGENLPPGEVGEICIRPAFKWAGYYDNPTATADIIDSDGWIHSGDLGYLNAEGNLYIVDRIKEILKYNNFHFYPTEIEAVINELHGVAEVCVCGIPDEVSTFLPTAAIVKTNAAQLTEAEVFEYVAKKLDHFKQLRGGIYFVDNLPKTVSGKHLRRQVVAICEQLRKQTLRTSAA